MLTSPTVCLPYSPCRRCPAGSAAPAAGLHAQANEGYALRACITATPAPHPLFSLQPAPSCPPLAVMDCILASDLLAACAAYRPLKLFLIQLALGMTAQQVGPCRAHHEHAVPGNASRNPLLAQLAWGMHPEEAWSGRSGSFGSASW